jgi:hypothetical protein
VTRACRNVPGTSFRAERVSEPARILTSKALGTLSLPPKFSLSQVEEFEVGAGQHGAGSIPGGLWVLVGTLWFHIDMPRGFTVESVRYVST